MKIFLRIFIHARNSINHHMLAWVVVAAVMTDMGLGGGACGTTIYADSLVGSGGALNGTPADTATAYAGGTAGATWTTAGITETTGGASFVSSKAAFLPITIQTGYIYTLTATLSTTTSGDTWTALGFSDTTNAGQWHTQGNKYAWAGVRGNGSSSPDFFFGGAGTANPTTCGSIAKGTAMVTITLDTTCANWKTSATIGGVSSTACTYSANPTGIKYVGFGADGAATSSVKNLSLTAVTTGSVADIQNFGLPGNAAVISGTNIVWSLPSGTDVTNLAPTYTHNGASATPASGSSHDFTGPVHYIVTAADSSTKDYTVTINFKDIDATGITLAGAMIWSPSAPAGTQAYVSFRKNFELANVPTATAMLHLFADSRYLLWVNGMQVLRGPCRFNPKRPEYDSIDIKTYLHSGSNTLVLLVHHYAGAINGRIMQHTPGLTAVLAGDGREILHTDPSWRCSSATEYRPSPEAWSSIPDVIDGRMNPGAWTAPGFNDASWPLAATIDGNTWGAMQPRAIPLPVETDLTSIRRLPGGAALASILPIELSTPSNPSFVLDLGRMAMAYASVEIDADAGSVLQLQYALRYVNGQPAETYGVGTTYTARAGRQGFIAADQWCARYVTVSCTSGRVKILGFKMIDRRYPFERAGSFKCSDETLTRLWEMAVNTIETVSDDAYGSDARERNEWLQDPAQPNFITTRVAHAGPGADGSKVFSDPRLLKNILRHAALSQLADGRILATFPTDRGPEDCHYVIEDYSCQWVEALKLYYDATGDAAFVREMWPTLLAQMQWLLDRRTARGLLLAREYTSFDNPLAYITCEGANINAFFYQALRDSAYLGQALSETSRADAYALAAESLYTAFNLQLWNATEKAYNSAYLNGSLLAPTVHAQLMALDRGLVPEDRKASTRAWLLANQKNPGGFHCGSNPDSQSMITAKAGINMPVVCYWLFQELTRMNTPEMDQEVISEMRRRWTPMVNFRQDTGTICEMFVDADGGGGSEACHNYGAVPAYFLSSYVLGVRPNGPVRDKQLWIEPRLGDLTSAEGVVVTGFGPVPVAWSRVNGEFHLSCTVPAGTRATLRVPVANASVAPSVSLDGQPLANPVFEGRFVTLPLGPGEHQMTAVNLLNWQGDGSSNIWNTGTPLWKDATGAAVSYVDGVTAGFGDVASNQPAITLTEALSPAALVVDATQDFSFGGTGALCGAMMLTKSGAGTLTINNSNLHTGGTSLLGGTLVMGNSQALGTGPVYCGGGNLAIAADLTTLSRLEICGSGSAGIDTRGHDLDLNADGEAGVAFRRSSATRSGVVDCTSTAARSASPATPNPATIFP